MVCFCHDVFVHQLTRVAAPECEPGRHWRRAKVGYTQQIDTWSLGCLFSVVATWVVLGSFSHRQYPHVRKLALQDLTKDHTQTFEEPRAHDSFHDGWGILQAVKSWHKYLDASIRKSDTITGLVLKCVEDHMLLGDPDRRMPSARLVDELQLMVAAAKMQYHLALTRQDTHTIPPDILKALLTLDNIGPTAGPSQSVTRDRGSLLALRPRTISVRKSDRIDDMPVQTKASRGLDDGPLKLNEPYGRPEVTFVRRPVSIGRSAANIEDQTDPDPPLRPPPSSRSPIPMVITTPGSPVRISFGGLKDLSGLGGFDDLAKVPPYTRTTVPKPRTPIYHTNVFFGRRPATSPNSSTVPRHHSATVSQKESLNISTKSNEALPNRRKASGRSNFGDSNSIASGRTQGARSTPATIREYNECSLYPIGGLRFELHEQWEHGAISNPVAKEPYTESTLRDFVQDRNIVRDLRHFPEGCG
jgi:hypothetical protein